MIKKNIFALFILAFSGAISQNMRDSSQHFVKSNQIQFSLGGHGLIYSIAYERILINRNKAKTSISFDGAYYPQKTGFISLWVPVLIHQLISFNSHHAEIGAGLLFTKDYIGKKYGLTWKWESNYAASIGYRYQKNNGKWMYRIAFTPIMESGSFIKSKYNQRRGLITEFHPLGSLTLGYCF